MLEIKDENRCQATYRTVNAALLAAFVLFLFAILIAYAYGVNSCWLRVLCGKDCILCGCTRDVIGILCGRAPTLNAASPFILACLAVELAWRVVAVVFGFWRRAMRIDIAVHIILLVVIAFTAVYTTTTAVCQSSCDMYGCVQEMTE